MPRPHKSPYESLRDHLRSQTEWADFARRERPGVFNNLHHWTGLKLYALHYWVHVYSTILPDHLRRLRKEKMAYVDILAGSGLNYIQEANDYLPGSTIIAARAPSKPFDWILALENEPNRSLALKRRLAQVRSEDSFEVIPFDADWHADTITTQLNELNAHYLAFVDYEGVHGFSWNSMVSLLQHTGDVFITLLPGWARVAGRGLDADRESLARLVGPRLADSARTEEELFSGYIEQIRQYRPNVVEIPIRSGQLYQYVLLFAARQTARRSPWMNAIDSLRANLETLTGDHVIRALNEIRGRFSF